MTLELVQAQDLPQFKADMQEAFQLGVVEGGYPTDDEPILPEATPTNNDGSDWKKSAW